MANGTIAASQLEMLSQSGTGVATIVPPATNTNRTLTLPDSTGTVATLGTTLTAATAVSASGTAVGFTGIPSWVKRITVMFSGVSTNGASGILLQLGDSGGVENTGYAGVGASTDSSSAVTTVFTTGFGVCRSFAASQTANGLCIISNVSGNTWAETGNVGLNSAILYYSAGSKTLSDTLDRVRITTVNGTDTFDAGTINILYEG